MPINKKYDTTKPITTEKLRSLPTGLKQAETPETPGTCISNMKDATRNVALLPEMLSIADAVKRTNCSYEFLRYLCSSKKIVSVKSGNKYLINSFSLAEYLNKGDQ